jgi:hypothetical protein
VIISTPVRQLSSLLEGPAGIYLAPIAALIYPAALWCFHLSVSAFEAGGWVPVASAGAALSLGLSFALPSLIVLAALGLAGIDRPTALQLRARKVAFVSVAAPTIFVFLGVLLYMAGNPVPDGVVWAAICISAIILVGRGGLPKATPQDTVREELPARRTSVVRVAHGIAALAIIMLFLALHIFNHLLGLFGAEIHAAFMKMARHVYRAKPIEPVLVVLLLLQVMSGVWLSWRYMGERMDRFRAFQLASGIYLAFYVVGHMDSVFILARTYLGIETDWAFATGAPQGLIRDSWNIRLVPHYWLGVFFVLSHLSSGLRGVLLAHGWRKSVADRIMIGGSLVGGLVAIASGCGQRTDRDRAAFHRAR